MGKQNHINHVHVEENISKVRLRGWSRFLGRNEITASDGRNGPFGLFIKEKKINDRINDTINDRKNDLDAVITTTLKDNKYVTIPQVAEKVGKSVPTINRHLSKMEKKGAISRVGSKKAGYWKVNE